MLNEQDQKDLITFIDDKIEEHTIGENKAAADHEWPMFDYHEGAKETLEVTRAFIRERLHRSQ